MPTNSFTLIDPPMSETPQFALRSFPHVEPLYTRRDFLLRGGAGFGALALNFLLQQDRAFARTTTEPDRPMAPRSPHFPARARSVIFLFMEGGPSHIDL